MYVKHIINVDIMANQSKILETDPFVNRERERKTVVLMQVSILMLRIKEYWNESERGHV